MCPHTHTRALLTQCATSALDYKCPRAHTLTHACTHAAELPRALLYSAPATPLCGPPTRSTPPLCLPTACASCSTFLLALLSAVEPRAINPTLVTPGESEEERRQNAK